MTEGQDIIIDCDPEGKQERSPDALVPAGDYVFLATNPILGRSAKGNAWVKLTMNFMHDDLKDHKPLDKYVAFIPAGKPGHGFTIMALKAFKMTVVAGPTRIVLSEFENVMVIGTVVVNRLGADGKGKEVNDIEALKPVPDEGDSRPDPAPAQHQDQDAGAHAMEEASKRLEKEKQAIAEFTGEVPF